jgi:hypothetical protein
MQSAKTGNTLDSVRSLPKPNLIADLGCCLLVDRGKKLHERDLGPRRTYSQSHPGSAAPPRQRVRMVTWSAAVFEPARPACSTPDTVMPSGQRQIRVCPADNWLRDSRGGFSPGSVANTR